MAGILKVVTLSSSLKNSGAVLPAYCDPPNPCPIGYTAKDGCISLEEFENTSEFSREVNKYRNMNKYCISVSIRD